MHMGVGTMMREVPDDAPWQPPAGTSEEQARRFALFLADTIDAGIRQLGANPANHGFRQLAEDLRCQARRTRRTGPAATAAPGGALRLVQ
jgi:hypothetical protein